MYYEQVLNSDIYVLRTSTKLRYICITNTYQTQIYMYSVAYTYTINALPLHF